MTVSGGDVIRVTCRFKSTFSGDVVNVYHFWVSAGTSADDDEVMDDMDALIDDLYTPMASSISNQLDPYDIRYDIVELVGGVEHVVRTLGTRTFTLTSPPAQSGDSIPQTNAAIVNLRTEHPKVFGRKYIGILGESSTENGSLGSTMLSVLATYGTTLIADYVGTTLTYAAGVLSSKASSSTSNIARFVGAVVNSVIGTQRRRRINRGS